MIIKDVNIVLENKIIYGNLLIKGKKIYKIEELGKENKNKNYLIPGFIDQHIHGTKGYDIMDNNFNSLDIISNELAKDGTTRFCATTMNDDPKKIEGIITNIYNNKDKLTGARVLGVHMEGPFINPLKAGAQSESYIKNPDLDLLKEFNKNKFLKIITLAPEIKNSDKLIKYCVNNNINVSIGHTNATYNDCLLARKNGAKQFTHAFNAMSKLHHREIATVGAMLLFDDLYAEVIPDFIHVSREALELLIKTKGYEKVILITDSMRATKLKDGISEIGGQKVIVKNKIAKLEDGTLAGSTLKFIDGYKNMFNLINKDLVKTSRMASLNPAKNLGISMDFGSIKKGKYADLVLIDNKFNILKTIIEGEIIYENKSI